MAEQPIIGIVMQTLSAVPGERPVQWSIGQSYTEAISRYGAVPWPLPPDESLRRILNSIAPKLDGLILAGGSDIDPSHYLELRRPVCGLSDPKRDQFELDLIKYMLDLSRPILGICRGIQMLNVALGGNLYQDLATQVPGVIKHDYMARQGHLDRANAPHSVSIKTQTQLARILDTQVVQVNSIHHQGIKDLGRDLIASAFAPDGVVEAIEMPGRPFVVGVQWHPEDLVDSQPEMGLLFQSFVDSARKSKEHCDLNGRC